MQDSEIKQGIYKDYRGKLFTTLFTATHEETGEVFVVYRASTDRPDATSPKFVCPLDEFTECVTNAQGHLVDRFSLVVPEDECDPVIWRAY